MTVESGSGTELISDRQGKRMPLRPNPRWPRWTQTIPSEVSRQLRHSLHQVQQLNRPDVSMELPAVKPSSSKTASKTKGKKGDDEEEVEEAGSSSDPSRKLATVS